MSGPQADATTDTNAIIAALRAERDAALSEKAALTEELAARTAELLERKTAFDERIEYQAATNDVLKAMSASPGDAQPVFELIVERARDLCDAYGASVWEYDGTLIHLRASNGVSDDPAVKQAVEAIYPMVPSRERAIGRAILDRQIIYIDDYGADPEVSPVMRGATVKSDVLIPLMRAAEPIGGLGVGSRERGGFSDRQIELMKTFAEQAVIAITSAETYRALQTRTSDLQQTLEYQTATSDVLKVISRSTFDLQPVLDTVVETAARLCDADQAVINRREGDAWRLAANYGFPPEFEADFRSRGLFSFNYPNTVAARATSECRPVHIHDVTVVPGYPDVSIRLGRQRTSLGVPLLREGEVIGTIVLARQRVEPFTDRQIELVSTFADQAVIAIENARLLTEQREALEQQTATAEVLQVINASPSDLAPVFETLLDRAMHLCQANFGLLVTFDGEHIEPAVIRGVPASYAGYLTHLRFSDSPDTVYGRILRGARFVHVPDLIAEAAYRNGNPDRRALVELGGARASLNVALRKDDALLGMISFYRQEARPFSERQIALLQNFAAQAVIAMENARLLTEQQEALEQQTATTEVLQVINASPGNLAPVFDAMLEKAMRLCGGTIGGIFTFDGGHSVTSAVRGMTAAFQEYNDKYPMDRIQPGTVPARVIETRGPVQTPDMTAAETYRAGHPYARALVELGGIRAVLAVPLLKDGVAIGMVAIYRQEPGAFTEKQIALLENFAAQAVIAIENARLITEQREALEQQTATAEVLKVINTNPGDLSPVFDTILNKAHTLCGAVIGSLVLFDGTYFRAVATHGWPNSIAALFCEPTGPNRARQSLVDGERFVQVPDIRAIGHEPNSVWGDALVESTDARTMLLVPLRKDGALLGFISAFRLEVRPFPEKEIALLENFAAQAVIAMENARLITETREALEQQTATAEVLQVINSSPGELGPVFDAILEKALTLCGAEHGSLGTYDGDYFRAVASRGYPAAVLETLQGGFHGLDNPVTRPLFDGARFVHIPDLGEVDHPIPKAIAALGGFRTVLFVPLHKDGKLLGHISASRQEVRSFAAKEIALLENFAAQAVIAMENARLLDEVRQRQAELRVTFENMGDGVALFDETPSLVAWNQKFQDILDLPDGVLAERLAFPDYIRYLTERGEYGEGANPEEQIRRLTGQVGEVRAYERTRPDGRVIEIRRNPVPGGGFVLIFSDISERKRNEAEIRAARDAAEEASRTIEAAYRELKTAQANLIQAEKMASLGQLTAGIAHEIKNPLNFVNNFATLSVDLLSELKETAAPGFAALTEKQRAEVEDVSAMLTSNLEKITEHGKRADGIVKAMLEHSRGSSGERRMVALNTLIDEALNLAYHGARAQDQSFNIALERDFGAGIAPIEVNPQDITRVFLNLFSNGFYAATRRAREGGDAGFVPALTVTTRDAGEAVEVRVRDNGTGIPGDIRDKLFQPFFTTKPTGEGTGLGLSITYDIVTQQHGGDIAVDSKVGDYSEFTIRLPRNR